MFRNLRMRWELRRGRALDIWSTGDCAYNSDRLVRVPSLNLCKGDILIYRKDSLDPEGFEGECLEIESDSYQTWQDVL